jgi:EmrB/QacA subfamily drug resistance transporter
MRDPLVLCGASAQDRGADRSFAQTNAAASTVPCHVEAIMTGPQRRTPDGEPVVSRLAWFTLAIASAAAFMVALEVTVISLALPDIQATFDGVGFATLSWIFNAYSIGVASLLLLSGWASDLLGRKRLFLIGMATFAVGSLGAGTAPSVGLLITARVVQSVGGALLFPSGLALILAVFPPARRQMAIGIWAATGGLAGAVGPSFGAFLIDVFGWRAVFLINVPVAVVAVVAGVRMLVESRAEVPNRRVDAVGVPLASLGVAALVVGIVQGRDWGWASPRVLAALIGGVVLFSLFIVRSRRHPAPLFDLGLLSIPSYRVGLGGALLFSAGFFGSWVLLPSFIQQWWEWSVLKTGLAVMPGSLIAACLSGPIGSVVDRFGHKRVVATGGMLGALGWLGFAVFMDSEPRFVVGLLVPNILLGLGMAVLFGMLVGASMRDVPPARYGMAGAGRTTTFQLAQSLGVAVGVAVVGRPVTAGAALSGYRVSWLLSAAMLAGVSVLFLAAYPGRVIGERPAVEPPAPADAASPNGRPNPIQLAPD